MKMQIHTLQKIKGMMPPLSWWLHLKKVIISLSKDEEMQEARQQGEIKSVRWTVFALIAAVPTQCPFKSEAFVISAQLKQSRLSQRTALKIGAQLCCCREWQVCSLCIYQQVWLLNPLSTDLFNLSLIIHFCLDAAGLYYEMLTRHLFQTYW